MNFRGNEAKFWDETRKATALLIKKLETLLHQAFTGIS